MVPPGHCRQVHAPTTDRWIAQAAQATSPCKTYGARQTTVRALRDVNATFEGGRLTAIMGRRARGSRRSCTAGRPYRRRGDGRRHGPHQLRLPHPMTSPADLRRCRRSSEAHSSPRIQPGAGHPRRLGATHTGLTLPAYLTLEGVRAPARVSTANSLVRSGRASWRFGAVGPHN